MDYGMTLLAVYTTFDELKYTQHEVLLHIPYV